MHDGVYASSTIPLPATPCSAAPHSNRRASAPYFKNPSTVSHGTSAFTKMDKEKEKFREPAGIRFSYENSRAPVWPENAINSVRPVILLSRPDLAVNTRTVRVCTSIRSFREKLHHSSATAQRKLSEGDRVTCAEKNYPSYDRTSIYKRTRIASRFLSLVTSVWRILEKNASFFSFQCALDFLYRLFPTFFNASDCFSLARIARRARNTIAGKSGGDVENSNCDPRIRKSTAIVYEKEIRVRLDISGGKIKTVAGSARTFVQASHAAFLFLLVKKKKKPRRLSSSILATSAKSPLASFRRDPHRARAAARFSTCHWVTALAVLRGNVNTDRSLNIRVPRTSVVARGL